MDITPQRKLDQEYAELVAKGEVGHPGITELPALYKQQLEVIRLSQDYLTLFQQQFVSSSSNNTR